MGCGQRHAPAALPPEKTRYPLCRRLGGPQGRSGQVRKISPLPGFDPRTVQPVASRCTDSYPGPWRQSISNVTEIRRIVFGASTCRIAHVRFLHILQRPHNVTAVSLADWHKLRRKQGGKRRVSACKPLPHDTRMHCVWTLNSSFYRPNIFWLTVLYYFLLRSTSWGQEGPHVLLVRLRASHTEIAPVRNFGSHVPLTEEQLVPPVSIHPTYVSFSYIYI